MALQGLYRVQGLPKIRGTLLESFRGHHDKEHSTFGFILGSAYLGKLSLAGAA